MVLESRLWLLGDSRGQRQHGRLLLLVLLWVLGGRSRRWLAPNTAFATATVKWLLGVVVLVVPLTTHDVARQRFSRPRPVLLATAGRMTLRCFLVHSRLLRFRWPRWRQRIAAIIAIHERLSRAFALLLVHAILSLTFASLIGLAAAAAAAAVQRQPWWRNRETSAQHCLRITHGRDLLRVASIPKEMILHDRSIGRWLASFCKKGTKRRRERVS